MTIHPFTAVFPNFDYVTAPDTFFESVKVEYHQLRKQDMFRKETAEALYLYRIQYPGGSYNGIVCTTSVDDYDAGRILKHENTLSAKEQTMINLVTRRHAMVKPVLLTYRGQPEIKAVMQRITQDREPYVQLETNAGKMLHQFWKVDDPAEIRELLGLFQDGVDKLYIADGHHRFATASHIASKPHKSEKAAAFRKVLSAIFPDDELQIMEFNRVVEVFPQLSPTRLLAELSRVAEIEALEGPTKPGQEHELTCLIHREWYRLRWRQEVLDRYQDSPFSFDAQLLNDVVLQDIVKISDVRNDKRIKYLEGPLGIEAVQSACEKNHRCVGFCLYPVDIHDMYRLVDQQLVMPPKSTWFEPRMKNGLIVLEY